jgi:hypothetical protein
MANTTSGTTTFDKTFSIDEIIEEAYERIGLNSVAGYQMKSARRSLNILFQEWGNRGIHYWEIAEANLDLIEGQAEYKFSNKLSKGTPNQYWVQRFIDYVSISIYPTPDSTNASKDMHFYYIKRIQDIGDYTNATDIPFRFVPCMTSGLAFYLAQKYQPQLVQQMKLYYEDELARALAEDGSASSTYITPKAYYPGS